MDEKKLELLRDLENRYPEYRDLLPGELDDFPDLLYLHDKGYVKLRFRCWASTKDADIEDLIQIKKLSFDKSRHEFVGARLAANGIDAINALTLELIDKRAFSPPATRKIEAITNSPWYKEAKDFIINFFAEYAVRMSI